MLIYVFAGQGTQRKGMGKELFREFKEMTMIADEVLGYSIEELCTKDPGGKLNQTEYTQPAVFVVNAMSYLKKINETGQKPDFILGHSLGEYNALLAAEVFDFKTGLELVCQRGRIMGQAKNGGMAAVIGLTENQVVEILEKYNLNQLDIANINEYEQIVIAGPNEVLKESQVIFERAGAKRFIMLKVGGAFHSHYMEEASNKFGELLTTITFKRPTIPVISNTYAMPYQNDKIGETLQEQIKQPVRWRESIEFLIKQGDFEVEQIGMGNSILRLVNAIKNYADENKLYKCENELWEIYKDSLNKVSSRQLYHFVKGEEIIKAMSGKEMINEAGMLGSNLQQLPKYSKAVLLLPQNLEYICTFLACIYAGVVMIPTPIIDTVDWENSKEKLLQVLRDSKAEAIITCGIFKGIIENINAEYEVKVIYIDELEKNKVNICGPRSISMEEVGLLLYTSGSTSAPKGAMLTYTSMLEYSMINAEQFGVDENSCIVSWMPLHHCFGMILNILVPIYKGAKVYLSTPKSFIEEPKNWWKNISCFKATHTGAPNFAFEYSAKNIDFKEEDHISLEGLKAIVCGGEPVQKVTYEKLMQKFKGYGLKRDVFTPHYGMSEVGAIATKNLNESLKFLYVDIKALQEGKIVQQQENEKGRWLTSCGRVRKPVEVIIVNPETYFPVLEGQVGEVWLQSPALAGGYYNREEETRTAFKATMRGLSQIYFRTGDLGSIVGGELYITGRIKEVIVVNGKNHYASDIELAVKNAIGDIKGDTVAFSNEVNNEEKVMVIQELMTNEEGKMDQLAERIFTQVTIKHQIRVYEIAFVKSGGIIKTSSGKINRGSCKREYVKGNLPFIKVYSQDTYEDNTYQENAYKEEQTPVDMTTDEKNRLQEVLTIVSQEIDMPVEKINTSKGLTQYGLNSLILMRLCYRINEKYEIDLSIREIFEAKSIYELVSYICNKQPSNLVKKIEDIALQEYAKVGQVPLTQGQRGLWMLQRVNTQSDAYNVPICLKVKDIKNFSLLKHAVYEVVAQNPILNSVVEVINGNLVLNYKDVAKISYEEIQMNEQEAMNFIKQESKKAFVMGKECLIRTYMIKLDETTAYVLFVIHHIVFDGKSMTLLVSELLDIYNELCLGADNILRKASGLKEYIDYYAKETELLNDLRGSQLVCYWQEQLNNLPAPVHIPGNQPKRSKEANEKARIKYTLEQPFLEKIKAFVKSIDINESVIFLAAYECLLFNYTKQTDFVMGMPIMKRNTKALEKEMGYFVNMLPIRSSIELRDSKIEFLKKVQKVLIDGLDHSSYPFSALVNKLNGIKRGGVDNPVFQTSFAYQNFYEDFNVEALKEKYADVMQFDLIDEVYQEGEFDYMLDIDRTVSDASIVVKYDNDIYSYGMIQEMIKQYKKIINGLMEDGEVSNLLNKKEETWKSLITLFKERVEEAPAHMAVVDDMKRVSYQELDEESDKIANYLRAQRLNKGDKVALCMERSTNWIIAVFGILKANLIYIPIDYNYPNERIKFILSDSNAKIMLTDEIAESNCELVGIKMIRTQEILEKEIPINSSMEKIDAEDDAYIIYTSGSTGTPKGVVVRHRGMYCLSTYFKEHKLIQKDDHVAQFFSLAFDATINEIAATFSLGATFYITPQRCRHDVRLYENFLNTNEITIAFVPPVYLVTVNPENVRTVKRIVTGGAGLDYTVVNKWHDKADCVNLYGPTEDTVTTTIWVGRTYMTLPKSGNIPIGTPINYKQVYILDKDNNILPTGEAGELCITGKGLAREYLNNKELTEKKFVRCPFALEERMYRTGDLAYKDEEGTYHFIGRIDTQVKYHGYRIELGEIEEKIKAYPKVQDCAVVLQNNEGVERLVAFCVLEEARDGLKPYLEKVLPQYMIPTFIVYLDYLPETINGKVDKKKLQTYKVALSQNRNIVRPQTQYEEILVPLWQETLKLDAISVTDTFFEVGGDSILAVMLADKISQELKLEVAVTDIFKYPSIKKFGAYLEQNDGAKPKEAVINLRQSRPSTFNDQDIAVIGISCNVPGAQSVDMLWNNLLEGKESIKYFSKEELEEKGVSQELINNPNFIPAKGKMENAAAFDNNFFKLSARDAKFMGNEARMLLTHSFKAIEDAGYIPEDVEETAVFMTTGNTPVVSESDAQNYSAQTFSKGGTVATIISYKLGLTGPSAYIHSNCSSSLGGLHLACQAIRNGEAKCALVGGCTINEDEYGYIYSLDMNHSSSGHIKAFDEGADGIVGGEGAVVFFIKKASEAIKDKDHIYALIKGSAMNNDGADKVGFYAPSVIGQSKVIQKALDVAKVQPETIGYVEAHGTGTKIGDPIEIEALSEAYRRYTDKRQFCGIGSIKSNIGHLDTAAGLAGCLKAILCVNKGVIVPTINYKKPNSNINFKSSPFYVTNELAKWETGDVPRRAAVSAFGIGGTNVHLILEQYIEEERTSLDRDQYIIPISASNKVLLKEYIQELLQYIEVHESEICIEDLAYTLQVGRKTLSEKVVFIATNLDNLRSQMKDFLTNTRV